MFSFLHFSLIDDLDLVSTSTSATILSERNTNQGSRFSLNPGLVSVSLTCSPACLSLFFPRDAVLLLCAGRTNRQTNSRVYALHCMHAVPRPPHSRPPNHFQISIYLSFIYSYFFFLLFSPFLFFMSYFISLSSFTLCSMYHLAVFCCLSAQVS